MATPEIQHEEFPQMEIPLHPKKRKVLHDGLHLSDAERRQVRQKQRSLQQQMLDGELTWKQGRIANNEIFVSRVIHAREMVIDADNCKVAIAGFAKEVQSTVRIPRFDAISLANKLSQKSTKRNGQFDWASLGVQAGVCFSTAPRSLSFLAGALNVPAQNRVKTIRRSRRARDIPKEDIEETRPEVVTNNKSSGDKLSAMEKLLKKVKHRLHQRTEEEKQVQGTPSPKVDAVRFLFNPQSFTQTVENIFSLSFLVKGKTAKIEVSDDKSFLSVQTLSAAEKDDEHPPDRQSVCSFTMADFRKLTENLEMTDLPHREASPSTENHA